MRENANKLKSIASREETIKLLSSKVTNLMGAVKLSKAFDYKKTLAKTLIKNTNNANNFF